MQDLDSSEHIYLGGAQGVRAYPQGEASGDTGALGTVELRYHTPVKGLLLSTYFDVAHVRIEEGGSDANISEDARSRQHMWFIAGGFPIKRQAGCDRHPA